MNQNKPKRHGVHWTPNEVSTLKKRHSQGLPNSEIAEKHQRSPFAIECQLARLNLIPNPENKDKSFLINGVDYTQVIKFARRILEFRIKVNYDRIIYCMGQEQKNERRY